MTKVAQEKLDAAKALAEEMRGNVLKKVVGVFVLTLAIRNVSASIPW